MKMCSSINRKRKLARRPHPGKSAMAISNSPITMITMTVICFCAIGFQQHQQRQVFAVEGSSFPGTIKHHPSTTTNSNDWWQTAPTGHRATQSNNSSDDGNKSDEEESSSSSEWEWDDEEEESVNALEDVEVDDDDDDVKGDGSSSSTGSDDNEEPTVTSASDNRISTAPSLVAEVASKTSATDPAMINVNTENQEKQKSNNNRSRSQHPSDQRRSLVGKRSSSSSRSPPPQTSKPTSNAAATAAVAVSNKPLQTLEKLQMMLDETDYMTSSSSHRAAATSIMQEDFSSGGSDEEDDLVEGDDAGDGYEQMPPEFQKQQESSPGPLWTSKDRSKYKKQIRQQQQLADQQQQLRQQQQRKLRQKPPPNNSPTRRPPPGQGGGEWQSPAARSQRHLPQYVPPSTGGYHPQQGYYRQGHVQPQQQRQQQPRYPPPRRDTRPKSSSSVYDVEEPYSDTDVDDGLGYTLPNLPVYLSDAEDSDSDGVMTSASAEAAEAAAAAAALGTAATTDGSSSLQQQIPPQGQGEQRLSSHPPPGTFVTLKHQQQSSPNAMVHPPSGYVGNPQQGWYYNGPPRQQHVYGPNYVPPPPAYFYPNPQTAASAAQSQHQQPHPGQQYGGQYYNGNWYPPSATSQYGPRSYVPRIDTAAATANSKKNARLSATSSPPSSQAGAAPPASAVPPTAYIPEHHMVPLNGLEVSSDSAAGQSHATTKVSFRSVLRISICMICSALICYAAVSPRNLSMLEYNIQFYANLRIAALTIVAPLLVFLLIVDMTKNNINDLIGGFSNAFTFGYLGCFASQIVAATLIRLGVFLFLEPKVFDLAPDVPLPIIPWVLKENKYRPKRITLFVQDFIASCVIGPILEELFKLLILQRSVDLPKNFNWVTHRSTNKKKKKKRVAEPLTRLHPGDKEVTNVNNYVSNMLAVSLGLKLADSIRRVCMYTKQHQQADRAFYAVFRGIFPIHELCGAVIVLSLARRDILGQPMPMWKLLLPSAIIHGMANFRGMKPIFKWNSATPWSEMQLSPDFMTEDKTLAQLAAKAFPKVMWLVILCRVAGYCVKNYYMINRQALKRTTTFAGKHSAFSAELAAAEMLKGKAKKNKKDLTH